MAVLICFSFPLQVVTLSTIPSLAPYLVIILIFILSLGSSFNATQLKQRSVSPIVFFIIVYVFFVIFHAAWQGIFGFISITNCISSLVIFLLPVLFFYYFRVIATHQEIRVFLFTISVLGLIIGTYWAYDSYSMLILKQVNDYSLKAFEYSQFRSPGQYISDSRISAGYRSHGLLENHSITAAWVVLGCFSALSLIPIKQFLQRSVIIAIFGMYLLVGLNFTSIVGFVIAILLVEYRMFALFMQGIIPKKIISLLLLVMIYFILFILLQFLMSDSVVSNMYTSIALFMEGQIGLATGVTLAGDRTYATGLVDNLYLYFYNLLEYPFGLIIGDCFSAFGSKKGGDYGVIDTLNRFGMIFFIAIFVGLIRLIYRALKKIEFNNPNPPKKNTYLFFASIFTMYLLFTEIHYSVWSSKSILPVLFFCLALFDRYMHPSIQIKIGNR